MSLLEPLQTVLSSGHDIQLATQLRLEVEAIIYPRGCV